MADSGSSAPQVPERYRLFQTGWRRMECPLSELWVNYLGLGGDADLFTLDAFLHGMMPLAPQQQDILANTINEQLQDQCDAVKVPYLRTFEVSGAYQDPLTVFDEIFGRAPRDGPDPH